MFGTRRDHIRKPSEDIEPRPERARGPRRLVHGLRRRQGRFDLGVGVFGKVRTTSPVVGFTLR
jgi:hypothetical protein